MARQGRIKTQYPGVYYIEGKSIANGKPERIYYIYYRRDGKRIEEKAGRQFVNGMTPARASIIRASRIEGKDLPNTEKRKQEIIDQNRWTVNRLWAEYKINHPNLKGIASDQNRYKNYLKPEFGAKEPSDIVPLDITRLRVRLLKIRKPGTVKNILELLRRIINFGINQDLCSPVKYRFDLPKVNNEKTEDLNTDQLKKLWEAIEIDENKQAANLMKAVLYTGMRRGELFKLKWEDIDNKRGFISLIDPKGEINQKIPLNEAAKNLFLNHERPYPDSPYVFPGRNGNQRKDIKHQVNRIKVRAGLPKDFRALHGLRHVYASMLASSGEVDLYTLQRLLTHKSPQMTQRYAHLRDDVLKRASEVAGNIVDNAINTKRKKTITS